MRKSGKVQLQARLSMTDRDVVERFAAVVGFGRVRLDSGKAHEDKGWKPLYGWSVYEAAKVRELIALFLPYMGDRRRERAIEVLDRGQNIRPHNGHATHCPHGHELSGENLILEQFKRGAKTYQGRRCRTCRRAQAERRKVRTQS
jgi:hypothetical protein